MEKKTADEGLLLWAEKGDAERLPAWEEFPSIPLYMDQVILYLNENLELFRRDGDGAPLTSSMINNYVKNGVLPHPEKKKYSREHLGALLMVFMLKQVLSFQDIKTLLRGQEMDPALYEAFREEHTAAMHETCRALKESFAQADGLREAALRLAVRANAQRAAAERILCELERAEKQEHEK